MQKRVSILVVGLMFAFVVFSFGLVLAENDDGQICCNYPGPADETLYEWRNKNNCGSPEGSEFPEQIVDDYHCEKEKEKSTIFLTKKEI